MSFSGQNRSVIHLKISSIDSKVRTPFYIIIDHSTKEKHCSVNIFHLNGYTVEIHPQITNENHLTHHNNQYHKNALLSFHLNGYT